MNNPENQKLGNVFASKEAQIEVLAESIIKILNRDKPFIIRDLAVNGDNAFGEFIRAYIDVYGKILSEDAVIKAITKHIKVILFANHNPYVKICARDGEVVMQTYGDDRFCVGLGDKYTLYLTIRPQFIQRALGRKVKENGSVFRRVVAATTDPCLVAAWFDTYFDENGLPCYRLALSEGRFLHIDRETDLKGLFYMAKSAEAKNSMTDTEYIVYCDALEYVASILAE